MAPVAGSRRRATALVHSPLARQIAALGLALCAVALSLAYPLRSYLHQQAAEQAAVAEQQQLQHQIDDLKAQQAALKDPDYVKAEARRRLQYVSPGETVYVVKVPVAPTSPPAPAAAAMPSSTTGFSAGSTGGSAAGAAATGGPAAPATAVPTAHRPWYESMWDTLDGSAGGGGAAGDSAGAGTSGESTGSAHSSAAPSSAAPSPSG